MKLVSAAVAALLLTFSGPSPAALAGGPNVPTTIGFTSGLVRETFLATPDGGIEDDVVIVPDPAAIAHLRRQTHARAKAFARGDFVDPTNPHGDLVPGLREMRRQWNKMHVRYQELPNGARVRYTTSDPVMVEALHQWFTARAVNKIK